MAREIGVTAAGRIRPPGTPFVRATLLSRLVKKAKLLRRSFTSLAPSLF